MKLSKLSKQLGVTPMTVYRRLEKKGININELRDGPRGELTSAGVATIAALFDTTTPQTALTGDVTTTQPGYNSTGKGDITGPLDGPAAVLQAKLDGANALIEQLTSERDALREQLAATQALLAAEQADRGQERRLLTGGDAQPGEAGQPRRRWWAWWRK